MASYNKVILIGNLTRDPEIRYTPNGSAIGQVGLALSRKWKDNTGQWKTEATFVDVTFFGKSAETIGQYLKKGYPLLVEGRLKLDQWDDKQTGQKRSALKVVGENFQFLGGGEKGDRNQESAPAPAPKAAAPTETTPGPEDDDQVPF